MQVARTAVFTEHGKGFIILNVLLAAIVNDLRLRVHHPIQDTSVLYSCFESNSNMAVATTQVYKLDDDICQPAYGFRLLGSLMHCLLSTERIPSIAADSMEPEHEQFLRRFCASPYVDLSRVFIIIVGATELQPVEAAGQPEVAGHVFENENWTPSLWASGIAPTVDNGIHGGWVAEEIAGFGFENDNRSSGIFCSADNDRQMYQDNTGSSYLEIDEGGPAAVQWKLVEGLFTPDKTIDMLLTLVKVDFPLQREAKWQGLTSSYPPLHALYGNYKAMSTVLEVMGLSADTKSEATRQHEYLGGKELSAEKVLAYFQWSTTSYVKKHGAFSFALEIAADDVCYCPGEDRFSE